MKVTNVIAVVVLLGGSIGMAGQCLPPDLTSLRKEAAELTARQHDLSRRCAAVAETRGDVQLAAFYRNLAVSRAVRAPGPG